MKGEGVAVKIFPKQWVVEAFEGQGHAEIAGFINSWNTDVIIWEYFDKPIRYDLVKNPNDDNVGVVISDKLTQFQILH